MNLRVPIHREMEAAMCGGGMLDDAVGVNRAGLG